MVPDKGGGRRGGGGLLLLSIGDTVSFQTRVACGAEHEGAFGAEAGAQGADVARGAIALAVEVRAFRHALVL